MNSLLQCLFHNVPFRRAVYAYRADEVLDIDASEAAGKSGGGGNSGKNGSCGSGGDSGAGAQGNTMVVLELQRIFLRLELGKARYTDTEELVKLLGFDRSYQQDPIECWKLFSRVIDDSFKECPAMAHALEGTDLRKVFQEDLGGGRQKNVTKCSKCHNKSER